MVRPRRVCVRRTAGSLMANEVTPAKIPGGTLAIAGKQFLRESFRQAFDRVGGIDAIYDWVMPEHEEMRTDPETGVVTIVTVRKRNNENFGQLLGLMVRLEPKEVNVKDERSIESTVEAIEAEFDVVDE